MPCSGRARSTPTCAPRSPTGPTARSGACSPGCPRRRAARSHGCGASTPIPSGGSRLVDDTRPLFPLGAIVAFAAGLTATIAYDSVVELLSTFVTDPLDLRFLAAVAFAPLAVGVVGVAIWREAFAALADGREPASPWLDGLAFALGLVLGPELALARSITAEDTLLRELTTFGGLAWAAVLAGGIVLLFAWIRSSASVWLRALGGRRPGARRLRACSSQPRR